MRLSLVVSAVQVNRPEKVRAEKQRQDCPLAEESQEGGPSAVLTHISDQLTVLPRILLRMNHLDKRDSLAFLTSLLGLSFESRVKTTQTYQDLRAT